MLLNLMLVATATKKTEFIMAKFSMRELQAAAEVISSLPVPVDQIPFTPNFEPARQRLCNVVGGDVPADRAWQLFLSARKRGMAQRKFRKPSVATTNAP
jgi:hypothetical protein